MAWGFLHSIIIHSTYWETKGRISSVTNGNYKWMVVFNITHQLLIRSFAFIRLQEKWQYTKTVHQLFIDLKKIYDSVRREVLYNILTELVYPWICSYEMVNILSDTFPIQNGLKHGYALFPLLLNMPLGRSKITSWGWNWRGHISLWSVLMMLIYLG
jgi:hypothetical protein